MIAGRIGVLVLGSWVAVATLGCDDPQPVFVDACTPTATVATVVSPDAYVCQAPFRATISITNGACATLTVNSVTITGAVTAGVCGPPGPGTYTPTTTRVGPGRTVEILDLTGGTFCCGAPGCAATMMCSETFTFAVDTSAGMLTATANAALDLGGCATVCP